MTRQAVDALLDLSDQVAIVTGASQGIGAAIARRLAAAGAAVIVHYRGREAQADAVCEAIQAAGGRAASKAAELTEPDDVAALIGSALESFGRLDLLVNNAGTFPVSPFLDMTYDDWRSMHAANVDTAFLCSQAAARQMRKTGGGAIVNIASIAATSPGPDHSHYNSAKAAVVMLTQSMAQELGPHGIRVNAVSPGVIARDGIEEAWPEGVARWRARAPLGRLGDVDDVANAVLFLASPAAAFVSGHDLVVDGGVLAASVY